MNLHQNQNCLTLVNPTTVRTCPATVERVKTLASKRCNHATRGLVRAAQPEPDTVRQPAAPGSPIESHADWRGCPTDGHDAAWDGPQAVPDQQPCTHNGCEGCAALLVEVLPNVQDDTSQPEVDSLQAHDTQHQRLDVELALCRTNSGYKNTTPSAPGYR